jgi:DNA polymerase-3 subunit delta
MAAAKQGSIPLVLIWGEDDFSAKRRAREVYQQWCQELGGFDHETIDAQITNSSEALKAIGRLREALQTLPFFGNGKAIWFQNCNFFGEERTASAQAVTEALADFAQELKQLEWKDVRLLINSGKVDRRKTFYKTVEKLGTVEYFGGWSFEDKDWAAQAESWAAEELRSLNKTISDEALAQLVAYVGPNARQLNNETQKLALSVGDRERINLTDVEVIVTRNKHARAFALGDALGERNLPRVLRTLDEELWEMKFDNQKSEIGLLYGLISKVRAMIFLKELLRGGWIKPSSDFHRFKAQLAQIPPGTFPEDKRFNPLALNSYVLFKALPQVRHYSTSELVQAMELLLQANQKLVLSSLDESLVLQQTLVQIVGGSVKPVTQN